MTQTYAHEVKYDFGPNPLASDLAKFFASVPPGCHIRWIAGPGKNDAPIGAIAHWEESPSAPKPSSGQFPLGPRIGGPAPYPDKMPVVDPRDLDLTSTTKITQPDDRPGALPKHD
jgi:hypothetical protein